MIVDEQAENQSYKQRWGVSVTAAALCGLCSWLSVHELNQENPAPAVGFVTAMLAGLSGLTAICVNPMCSKVCHTFFSRKPTKETLLPTGPYQRVDSITIVSGTPRSN